MKLKDLAGYTALAMVLVPCAAGLISIAMTLPWYVHATMGYGVTIAVLLIFADS
jgi:hypothetical protein